MLDNKSITIMVINFKENVLGEKKIGLNDLKEQYKDEFASALEGLYKLELINKINSIAEKINNLTKKEDLTENQQESLLKLNEEMKGLEEINNCYTGDINDYKNASGLIKLLAWAYRPINDIGFFKSEELALNCYQYFIKTSKTEEDTANIKKTLINYINDRLGENSNFKLDKINNDTLNRVLSLAFIKKAKWNKYGINQYETLTNKEVVKCDKVLLQQFILFTIGKRVGYYKSNINNLEYNKSTITL